MKNIIFAFIVLATSSTAFAWDCTASKDTEITQKLMPAPGFNSPVHVSTKIGDVDFFAGIYSEDLIVLQISNQKTQMISRNVIDKIKLNSETSYNHTLYLAGTKYSINCQ